MAMEECRTEASIGIEYSESVNDSSEDENTANSTSVKTAAQGDGCSPSERKKRKRISPHSTPKVAEGTSFELTIKCSRFAQIISLHVSLVCSRACKLIISGIHHLHAQAKLKSFSLKLDNFGGKDLQHR